VTVRDLVEIAFRTLAVWFMAGGVAGVASALVNWSSTVASGGKEIAIVQLATASLYLPVGALIWLASGWAAGLAFPRVPPGSVIQLDRADLYAFASALVGLSLLADALPHAAARLVYWRATHGSDILGPRATEMATDVRADVAAMATRFALGILFLLGPHRLAAAIQWLRREWAGPLDQPDRTPSSPPKDEADSVNEGHS
jgi:hypothetical protein